MFRACLLLSLVASASAVDFSRSTILTSADISNNNAYPINNLKPNTLYRVYATYASSGSEAYARNVIISDNTGASLNVAGLDTPNPNSQSFLDGMRTLRAPITIQDNNVGAVTKTPFTIYVVDTSVTSFPVVSARQANTRVDSKNGFIAAGLTVLSAEPLFTMSSFDIGGISNMVISSVGFDENSNKYNVLNVDSRQANQAFLTVYGPIATLFNTNWGWTAQFAFNFNRGNYNYQLAPGATTALLSPGYLSNSQSYNIPYQNGDTDALARTYNFGSNCYIRVDYWVQDFQNAESILFRFTTSDNQPIDINLKNNYNNWQWQLAKTVSMNVQNPNGNHAPRYLFQIDSSASLSFSLMGILLVSLFMKY